jgi:hypothetical protein
MSSARTAGRLTGVLILIQMVGGAVVNFVLAAPLFGSPGFLVGASAHAGQIALSALCGIAVGAISLAVAVTLFPLARERAGALALWFFALATVGLAAAVIEQINVMSMLSLSEAYAMATAAEQGGFQGLRIVVAASRNWSHFLGLVVSGCTIFVFYLTLYRAALAPRALAAFGMAATSLQIVTVAMPLFGQPVVFPLLAPLGVSQLLLALWLLAKGFPDPELAVTHDGGQS